MSKDKKEPVELNEEELKSVDAGATARISKSSPVLYFDEAYALFGKRTKVKNAKNRYANLEVSH